MSKNSKEYFNQINTIFNNRKRELIKEEENKTLKIYEQAFNDAYQDLMRGRKFDNPTARQVAKAKYVKQLAQQLEELQSSSSEKLSDATKEHLVNLTKIYPEYMSPELSAAIDKNVDILNERIIKQIVTGALYRGGEGLSDKLWKAASASGKRIDDAIASMIAQGMGATEMAKNLKEFAKDGHRIWSKNKIREKLGDAYARKYGQGGLDYEALRLARTTLQHQAQLAVMNADKVNPYAGAVKWKSSHQANRTCSLCISRETDNPDGLGPGIYYSENCPLDHPNGLCHLTHVFIMNGKVVTPEEMADDIGKWIRGEPNSGTMDKLYKDL